MQLDIFADSRDTQLRNDVADALLRHDAAAARSSWATLSDAYPDDAALAPLEILIQAAEDHADTLFASHDEAAIARRHLLEVIEPAALGMLGQTNANTWLPAFWSKLARRSARLPFDAQRSDDHAAPLWLRARRWNEAAAAVELIESWRRIPAPLAWMAEARYHQQDLDGTWPLLAELAWMSFQRLAALEQALADPLLQKLRAKFEANFDGGATVDDLCWFPAWLLTEKPSLAPMLSQAQRGAYTAPEQAMRLLVELLGLERQGRQHDLVQKRKALRDTSQALYAAYMATR